MQQTAISKYNRAQRLPSSPPNSPLITHQQPTVDDGSGAEIEMRAESREPARS